MTIAPVSAPIPPFLPAPFLSGPHRQTIWGRLVRSRDLVALRRERLEAPDGERLVLDHAGEEGSPRLLVLHGLEGSSRSVYVQGMAAAALARGLAVTVLNFRSCAVEGNGRTVAVTRPRLYHSGETADLDHVARTLAARSPGLPLVAVGVSLGGNALLKWLGENPAQPFVAAAATVSVPYDLEAGSRFLECPSGRLYVEVFLKTLRGKSRDLCARFREARERIDIHRLELAQTFWDLDDAATGPLHGFAGADDYYARSSSVGFLSRVATPTLCLSATDDPFLPPSALTRVRAAASKAVTLVEVPRGGHAGFVGGESLFRPSYWAEEAVIGWLAAAVSEENARA